MVTSMASDMSLLGVAGVPVPRVSLPSAPRRSSLRTIFSTGRERHGRSGVTCLECRIDGGERATCLPLRPSSALSDRLPVGGERAGRQPIPPKPDTKS